MHPIPKGRPVQWGAGVGRPVSRGGGTRDFSSGGAVLPPQGEEQGSDRELGRG